MGISSSDFRRAIRAAVGPAFISYFESLVARRSWEQTQALGRKMGHWGYRFHRRYRETAKKNIRLAFGDSLTESRVSEIADGCLQHLVTLFLEALRMPSMSREDMAQHVQLKNYEFVTAALEQDKGAIFFSGHFGNWELGAVRMIYEGAPILPLSRAARSPRLAKAITAVRKKLDFPVIPVEEGVKGILRALKQNYIVPIMPDRFARGQGMTVPFFDRPTHVWHTPAIMAQRAGCSIYLCHAIRQPDGLYELAVLEPVAVPNSGDRDHDLWLTTARTMAIYENLVRRNPEQFTWPYKLWRPDDTPPSPFPFEELDDDPVIANARANRP